MSHRRIYDCSPLLEPGISVFPGDTPLSREVLMDCALGHNITLSTLRTTVHVGTHADAPSHYGAGAKTIEQMELDRYLGPCRVVSARGQRDERVRASDLVTPLDAIAEPRLLIRTDSQPDKRVFNEDFRGIEPALIAAMGERGVRLLGVDTPSVDDASSKDLPAHAACLSADIAILEGLCLEEVPDGVYELIALPLKLAGFDASPVRVVLREL